MNIKGIINLPIDINPENQQLGQLTHQVSGHLVNYIEEQVKRTETLVQSKLLPTTPNSKDVPATTTGARVETNFGPVGGKAAELYVFSGDRKSQ